MTGERHPATRHLLQYFNFGAHMGKGPLREISEECSKLAWCLAAGTPDGPELTAGLRKLLEAKDCFVRAALPPPPEDE